jgi:hypothetical protein
MNKENIINKTIKDIQKYGYEEYTDIDRIKITFTDDTCIFIIASYGCYEGGTLDEYPSTIEVLDYYESQNKEKEVKL